MGGLDYKTALLKDLTQAPPSGTIRPALPPFASAKKSIKKSIKKSPQSQSVVMSSKNLTMPEKESKYTSSSRIIKARRCLRRRMRRLTSFKINNRFMRMGLFTENNSATYMTTGNPCLDFFFHVVPDTPQSQLVERLKSSWAHDPLTTLKLICNLRGVRGTGKTDKEGFYNAALWLHKFHPKTLAGNVHVIAWFGYFKDLLEILFRILEGHDARSKAKQELISKMASRQSRRLRERRNSIMPDYYYRSEKEFLMAKKEKQDLVMRKRMMRIRFPREARIEAHKAKAMKEKENASNLRRKKKMDRAKKVQNLYRTDVDFRFLYEQISSFFAEMLKADMEFLNSGKTNNISLAGKWCPTIDSSYDRYTLICTSIAKKVFPRELYPEYEGIEDARYVYRVRDRLRKQVLVPLHQALKLPEVYMSARKWNELSYNRVASVAMTNYTTFFKENDNKRFSEYLVNVKKGKAKIAAGALLPHNIIESCLDSDSDSDSEEEKTVAELQWKRMVDDMLTKGKLTNCIAVCDVSGSMCGTPMEVSVALGLLVSELSEEPWKGQVITFSQNPQLHLIQGSSLQEKCQFIKRMDWGMNTDFQKVFDQILKVAVAAKLSEEQMIKTVFVFSDMEFDQASSNPWETDYMVIQRKFKEKGYERVPDIVFWNLRHSSATPVKATQNGVAMLSGYSKNLLKLFLGEAGKINPEFVMEAAISGNEYQKLVVHD